MNFDKSLQDIIFDMLCNPKYVFYGLFLAELNKGFDDNFPTACVAKHPNSANIQLLLGKQFWEKTCYNNSRKTAILLHELEHVIREHLSEMASGMFPQRRIANIAMDISINQCITEELPRTDENGEKCGVFIEDFPELNLKPNESSLYYYNRLLEKAEEKKSSGTTGSKLLDDILDGKVMPGDWHDKWNEITKGMGDKEKELLKKEIQEQLRRIAEETQKLRGTVPGHIGDAIKEDFGNKPPVISWKTLFNRFIGSTLTTEIRQTRKRPNFRFEDAPTNKYKNKVRIVVGCDTSGSVSDHELKEFFGQIKHMWKAGVKVDIILWDAEADDPYEYKGENVYKRTRAGGTHASCFIQRVNKEAKKKNWTCAINLTDGYIENNPDPCNIPMLWVITSSGNTGFEHKSKKIKMN